MPVAPVAAAPAPPPRPARPFLQHAAVEDYQQPDRDAEGAAESERRAPVHERHQEHHGHRRNRVAEHPARGMEGERAAHAMRVHRGIEQGVVGRVVYRVGESRHRHQGDERAVERHEPDEDERGPFEQQAGDEDPSRPEPVHRESDRHLGAGGDDAEHADRESELGIPDPVSLAQERKERWEEEQIEVAREVRGADHRDRPRGPPPLRRPLRAARFDRDRHGAAIPFPSLSTV